MQLEAAILPNPTFVIVGGGLAGLFCALKLAPLPVTVFAAAPLGEGSSSAWAQGGIAAAVAEGDSAGGCTPPTRIAAGAGLVDDDVALGLAREAGARDPTICCASARRSTATRRPARALAGSRPFGAAHRACQAATAPARRSCRR